VCTEGLHYSVCTEGYITVCAQRGYITVCAQRGYNVCTEGYSVHRGLQCVHRNFIFKACVEEDTKHVTEKCLILHYYSVRDDKFLSHGAFNMRPL
jgi:hypothetical protein